MTVSMFGKPTHACPVCHMQITTLTFGKKPQCSVCEVPLVPIDVARATAAALEGIAPNNGLFTNGT